MSGYIVVLCIIATAFVAVYGDELQLCPLKYEDCGSGLSRVLDAHYSGTECPSEGDPAELPKGSTVQLFVDFIPNVSTVSLKASVQACFGSHCMPFPGAPTDACQGANITCPVKSGVQYTYAPVLPIQYVYPSMSIFLKWQLQGMFQNDIVCIRFPVKIE
ncbi:ecdysteroid-regulated 16 kDa protein-like [Pomacea canaliculata]|uniref:ecdysteroid-regulated 16 kDa protein-like n=1 Tax=Pomacea canaliculata TaxID=400727 RepID=UPI000D734F33|nr:ecdysteroid-regulated 16 kDa protein-like [Pomacea canaliculata]